MRFLFLILVSHDDDSVLFEVITDQKVTLRILLLELLCPMMVPSHPPQDLKNVNTIFYVTFKVLILYFKR